jgi:hypothetical protein
VVKVTAGGKTQVKAINPMTGFISCDEAAVQFGLGDHEKIDRLVVEWPAGGIDRFEDLEAGFHYLISESRAPAEERKQARPRPQFVKVKLFSHSMHRELPFEDYFEQPLIPWKQSQMGPGIAWGDVDGDGDDDCFLAQAEGTAGQLSLQQADRRFEWMPRKEFAADSSSEDMAPLFFDADGDGRLDLLVTSGSVEKKAGDPAYRDRLYLGKGEPGEFAPAHFLPGEPVSSSVAAAADIDRDGDLDLFIGGRVIPGRWPKSPGSRLYLNESQPGQPKFVLAPDEQAGALKSCERATAAIWSDLDRDGWLDLMVTHEYGPIRVFQNRQGTLVDLSDELGFRARHGLWNGLAGRDLDGDGDLDFVATNFGINTTYKASAKKPELLYYGDLEGTGEFRLVEAKFGDDCQLPRRGLSCSSNAMPSLKDKLGTYQNFAIASLSEIYSPRRLESSGKLEMTELRNFVFLNQSEEGRIKFDAVPLPRMAQLAPGFGVVITELTGDDRPEVVLAQNFYSPQREVGRMSGSVGASVLSWKGDGQFEVLEPRETGVLISGDTKAVTVNEFNGDGIPDLAFTENNGPVSTFLNSSRGDFIAVKVRGKKGNLRAIGTRMTLKNETGDSQTIEIVGGGSYLSQSGSVHFFGGGKPGSRGKLTLHVRWPDGETFQLDDVKPGSVELRWQ